VKVREQLILTLEEDSADVSAGSGSGTGDLLEGGEPALFGPDHPGKHSLGVPPAPDWPGPKLTAEISVGMSLLCCASSQLPSRYPNEAVVEIGKLSKLCANAYVPLKFAYRVKEGQKVVIQPKMAFP
jgi:hypothetical protein